MKRQTLRSVLTVVTLALGIPLLVVACGDSKGVDGTVTTSAVTASQATSVSGSIVVSGLVDYPMTFITLDTDYMDWASVTAEDPETGSVGYYGVRLSEVFSYVGVQSGAQTVVVTGNDGSSVQLTLADIGSDALLTVSEDDSFDLVMPGVDSGSWVKDVVKMEFK